MPARSPLITVAELLEAARSPVILDVRWNLGGPPGVEEFREGHIPGAVFCDLDRDLAAPPGKGGRHPLPATADFQESMRRLGVSDGRPVVVYDAAASMAAARAWWLLRYCGHADVRVLDGGYRAWRNAGQRSEAGPGGESPAGDFTASTGHLPLLGADAAASLARTGLLFDARAGERYRGETEPVDPVAGHIPGAVSAPTGQNVTPEGTFRSPATLGARFASLGAPIARAARQVGPPAVGAYCGSGVTAAHEVLALTLAGIPAALYAGSWSEWIEDPTRPVATGAPPG